MEEWVKEWDKELKVQMALGVAPCYSVRFNKIPMTRRWAEGTWSRLIRAVNREHAMLIGHDMYPNARVESVLQLSACGWNKQYD